MAKARKRERITAWFFAAIFILSSSALTVAIVLDNLQKDNNSVTSQQADNATNQTGGNMLAGTQLSDFTPIANIPELQRIDTKVGDGAEVKAGDTVTVDYTGAVAATGKIFQSSKDSGQPVTFGLDQVIKGWTEGVPGMKVGGTRRLLIPAVQAYGANPPQGAGIPANADLVFDITLQSIGQ